MKKPPPAGCRQRLLLFFISGAVELVYFGLDLLKVDALLLQEAFKPGSIYIIRLQFASEFDYQLLQFDHVGDAQPWLARGMLHRLEIAESVVDGAGKFISGHTVGIDKRKRVEDALVGNVAHRLEGPVL